MSPLLDAGAFQWQLQLSPVVLLLTLGYSLGAGIRQQPHVLQSESASDEGVFPKEIQVILLAAADDEGSEEGETASKEARLTQARRVIRTFLRQFRVAATQSPPTEKPTFGAYLKACMEGETHKLHPVQIN